MQNLDQDLQQQLKDGLITKKEAKKIQKQRNEEPKWPKSMSAKPSRRR